MKMDKTVRALSNLLNEAKKARKPIDTNWEEYLRWFTGKQKLSRANYKANTVTNFLFQEIQTIIPILTARSPEISVKGVKKEYKEKGESITNLIHRIKNRNRFTEIMSKYITNGLIFGKSFLKATWDNKKLGGFGDILFSAPDSRFIYFDTSQNSINGGGWIFEVRKLDALALFRMFPDRRNDINYLFKMSEGGADMLASEEIEGEGKGSYEGTIAAAPGSAPATETGTFTMDYAASKIPLGNKIEFVEAWFVDETTVEEIRKIHEREDITQEGKEETIRRMLFPRGRVVAFAGDVKFYDYPNPFPRFPYIEFTNYTIPGRAWGMSELEQTIPVQKQYNIRKNQIKDALDIGIAPIRLFDASSGLDPDLITNRPGQWLPCNSVAGVRDFKAQEVHAATFASVNELRNDIETIFGVREASQGSVPGDVRSGYAVEALQEAAQVRLRQKSRAIEESLKDMAEYITNMIGMHYKPGIHYGTEVDLRNVNASMFEYEVKAGVSLPASRFAEQQMVMWMFDRGMIDKEYVVNHSQLEGKEDLIKRLKPVWDAEKAAVESQINSVNSGALPNEQAGGITNVA